MFKAFVATLIDAVVGPFGFDVYISVTRGRRDIDRFWIVRRAAGAPRPQRPRPKALLAAMIDAVVGPLGFDVYISVTHGRRDIDRFWIVRRAAGTPRPKRLRPFG